MAERDWRPRENEPLKARFLRRSSEDGRANFAAALSDTYSRLVNTEEIAKISDFLGPSGRILEVEKAVPIPWMFP
jgi:hypothetical protein